MKGCKRKKGLTWKDLFTLQNLGQIFGSLLLLNWPLEFSAKIFEAIKGRGKIRNQGRENEEET